MKLKFLIAALLLGLAACTEPSQPESKQEAAQNRLLDIGYTQAELVYIATHPRITYAAEVNHPPYMYRKGEKIVGISQDYLDLISIKTGIQFVGKNVDTFPEGLEALRSRDIDLITTTRMNEERLLYLSFSQPYSSVEGVQVSIDPIPGDPQSVGIAKAFAIKGWLEVLKPQIKIVEFPTDTDSIKALSEGKVPASMMDSATYHWIKPLSDRATLVKEIPFDYPYRFAVLKSDVALVGILDKALANTSPEEKAKIEAKWIKKD